MKKRTELYSREELTRLERKNRIVAWVLAAVGAAGLGVCVVLCCLTRTGNAAVMERAAIAVSAAAGWFVLYGLRFVLLKGRRELAHGRMLLEGEREAVTGTLELMPGTESIRNSIDIRRFSLTEGETVRRACVNARKAALLSGAAGRPVTVYLVNGYAAAFEAEEGPGTAEPAPASRKQRGRRLRRGPLSRLHEYVLWLLVSVLLWSWIFTLVTDAPRAKKVVLFADAESMRDTALAAVLEEDMPRGIRMVQAHPFAYAMFSDSELTTADIYIVKASEAAELAESFGPLPAGFDAGDRARLDLGGACGVKVYDAESGAGAAGTYIAYAPEDPGETAEDYDLFFNRESPHTGETDTAALIAAARLMELP